MKKKANSTALLTHVAIRFRDQIWSLPRPYRHHHIIRVIIMLEGPDVDGSVDGAEDDQGFLDNTGKYLSRREARAVAEQNGQLRFGQVRGSVLTSEDLW